MPNNILKTAKANAKAEAKVKVKAEAKTRTNTNTKPQSPPEPPHKRFTESQHESIKRAIIKREEKNYNKIYFVPCSGDKGWYEIAEHSALIYYFNVAIPLGLTTHFHEDTMSFYTHYQYGLIRTNNPDHIKANLESQNLFKSVTIERDVIIYTLTKSFTEQDIEGYWQQIRTTRITNSSIIKTDNASPEYHLLITALGKNLLYACSNKMNVIERANFSPRTIGLVTKLNRLYLQLGYLDREKNTDRVIVKWNEIVDTTYHLIVELHLISDFGIWAPEVVARFSDQLIRARTIARKEITKLNKQKSKQSRKPTPKPQTKQYQQPKLGDL